VCIVIWAMLITGCPKKGELEKAYNVSESISTSIEVAADNVTALFEAGLIDYKMKEIIVHRLRQAREGGKRFHAALDVLHAAGKISVSESQLGALDVMLNAEVVRHFSEILVDLNVLSPETQAKVLAAIVLARQAVVTIITLFIRARGRTSANYDFYIREKEFNHATV
jgi:hypothetical protein